MLAGAIVTDGARAAARSSHSERGVTRVQLRGRSSSEALRSLRRQPASPHAVFPWAPG